jgi:hypothetical protein
MSNPYITSIYVKATLGLVATWEEEGIDCVLGYPFCNQWTTEITVDEAREQIVLWQADPKNNLTSARIAQAEQALAAYLTADEEDGNDDNARYGRLVARYYAENDLRVNGRPTVGVPDADFVDPFVEEDDRFTTCPACDTKPCVCGPDAEIVPPTYEATDPFAEVADVCGRCGRKNLDGCRVCEANDEIERGLRGVR